MLHVESKAITILYFAYTIGTPKLNITLSIIKGYQFGTFILISTLYLQPLSIKHLSFSTVSLYS